MRFTLFKTPAHRIFNYIPRYYDPKKERQKNRKDNTMGYVPGQQIRNRMRHSIIDYRKSQNKYQRIRTIIIFITVGLLFLIAYLSVKYFTFLWPT